MSYFVFEVNVVEGVITLLHDSVALFCPDLSSFYLKYAHPATCAVLKLFFNEKYLQILSIL